MIRSSFGEVAISFNPFIHGCGRVELVKQVCILILDPLPIFSGAMKAILLSYASRAAYRHSGIFNIPPIKKMSFLNAIRMK